MNIKKIKIFGILFFLFGVNFGSAIEDIPLNENPRIWPIRGGIGTITMFFGENIHPITGKTHFHSGIDISTFRTGDAIVATADGYVITAEYDYNFGNFIIIDHNNGFNTFYAHMQYLIVQVGQRVQQGEIIGFIGNSGISTGPHLHYEIRIFSVSVDPLQYINNL